MSIYNRKLKESRIRNQIQEYVNSKPHPVKFRILRATQSEYKLKVIAAELFPNSDIQQKSCTKLYNKVMFAPNNSDLLFLEHPLDWTCGTWNKFVELCCISDENYKIMESLPRLRESVLVLDDVLSLYDNDEKNYELIKSYIISHLDNLNLIDRLNLSHKPAKPSPLESAPKPLASTPNGA